MTLKKFIFTVFVLICTISTTDLVAQTQKELRIEKREVRKARRDSLRSLPVSGYIHLDLVAPIAGSLPRLSAGYTHRINERWYAGASLGYGFDGLSSNEAYQLWEIRPEILYHFVKTQRFHHFVGMEFFYINNSETQRNGEFVPVNNQNGTIGEIRFDRADYERTKYGVLLNYGEYTHLSNRLALRTTIGAGVRFKDNSFTNVVNPVIGPNDTDGFLFPVPNRREGFRAGFEFNLNVKLIYKFN